MKNKMEIFVALTIFLVLLVFAIPSCAKAQSLDISVKWLTSFIGNPIFRDIQDIYEGSTIHIEMVDPETDTVNHLTKLRNDWQTNPDNDGKIDKAYGWGYQKGALKHFYLVWELATQQQPQGN